LDNQAFSSFVDEHVEHPRGLMDGLDYFTLTVIQPSGTGSKGGITVEELLTPYHLGRITVRVEREGHGNETTLYLKTSNIKRFKFANDVLMNFKGVTMHIDNEDSVWRDSVDGNGQDVIMEQNEHSKQWKASSL
jgi:hypothetical protein